MLVAFTRDVEVKYYFLSSTRINNSLGFFGSSGASCLGELSHAWASAPAVSHQISARIFTPVFLVLRNWNLFRNANDLPVVFYLIPTVYFGGEKLSKT